MIWRSPAKVAEPVLPASLKVVTPLAEQKRSVWPPMSWALTKMCAWMSTRPGVTSRPRALIVRRASFFGNDAATSTILPPLIATSSWPLSPAAGSSTSPSVTSRSYFIAPSPPPDYLATLLGSRRARHPAPVVPASAGEFAGGRTPRASSASRLLGGILLLLQRNLQQITP